MRSDVIGDFQEPYDAVLVEGDDMAALPSNRPTSKAARMPERVARGQFGGGAAHGATLPTVDGAGPVQRKPAKPPSAS